MAKFQITSKVTSTNGSHTNLAGWTLPTETAKLNRNWSKAYFASLSFFSRTLADT